MKHTKGEWIAKPHSDGACAITSGDIVITILSHRDFPERNEANARRIAKCVNSHDALLAACKRIKDRCDTGGLVSLTTTGLYNCVKAAIAKAE